jgi:citrate lyase beta subunit
MRITLSAESLAAATRGLTEANRAMAARYPGETGRRQPVHSFYGGAHLFRADTAQRLGALALESLERYARDAEVLARALEIDPALAERIYDRVREKLRREPVEDYRIDFEDGYGNRPDAEEDASAVAAAREVAAGMKAGTLPPFIGIRLKPLSEELRGRSLRTLDLFLTALLDAAAGALPSNFVLTLPKVAVPEQAAALARVLEEFEKATGLARGSLRFEIMIEVTQSILNASGASNLPLLYHACGGRCAGAHFGTYDYTASCGITAAHQHMLHPACDFARSMMQVAFAGTGLWLSDGGTNVMPVPAHRGHRLTEAQRAENLAVIHRAWKLHFDHIQHSLANAFYQGWDLHPAQLPARYAAVYAFYLESLDAAAERLKNFVDKAAQATLVGDIFDDAATGQGLLNFFMRAINCGAIGEAEAQCLTGLTHEEFLGASFVKILGRRRAQSA